MSPDPVVQLVELSKSYGVGAVGVKALDAVSLTVAKGEFLALSGPSGSGKTTLLNLIGGLDAPTSGKVVVEGHVLGELGATAVARLRRDRLGFVFQAHNLIPILTALENAAFVLELQKRPKDECLSRARDALARVGLSGMEYRRPHELSGGQQQRVAIARAIAPEPALVLADEPTASLDSQTATSLIELMEGLNRGGVTFVFSTHDQRIMDRAHRLVPLRDGRLC